MRWLASRDRGSGDPGAAGFSGPGGAKAAVNGMAPLSSLLHTSSLRDSNSVLPDTWLMADSRGSRL